MIVALMTTLAAGPISHTISGYIIIGVIVGIAVVMRLIRGRRGP
jgi:hypothetical protein